MLNLFGNGFIGKEYSKRFVCEVNERNNLDPITNNILYLISTVHNYHVFDDTLLDINTNLVTLIKVLDNARNKFNSDFTFNFVSSWFVYGNTDMPATENSICNPKGFYSITKKTAEDLLISYCETFGIKYRIMRLCNVLGNTDEKVSAKKNALQFLIQKLKNNEDIELYDSGNFYRDYMHVDDVVSAINLVINKGNTNEIFNIGFGEPVLFKLIIDYAKDKINSKSNIIAIPPKEFHSKIQVKSMYMDNSKIKKLGFTATKNIFETIDTLI